MLLHVQLWHGFEKPTHVDGVPNYHIWGGANEGCESLIKVCRGIQIGWMDRRREGQRCMDLTSPVCDVGGGFLICSLQSCWRVWVEDLRLVGAGQVIWAGPSVARGGEGNTEASGHPTLSRISSSGLKMTHGNGAKRFPIVRAIKIASIPIPSTHSGPFPENAEGCNDKCTGSLVEVFECLGMDFVKGWDRWHDSHISTLRSSIKC
ncbi:hypothetical protein F5887DRAFT_1025520 [Amanita rubescens]|nr:hypothetical protein F5887DRAFT_1025520 [Amanita rubescens]